MNAAPAYGNTSRAVWSAGVPLAYHCGHWWRDPDDDEDEYEDEAEHVDDFDFDDSPCEVSASKAEDRWIAERDSVASQ